MVLKFSYTYEPVQSDPNCFAPNLDTLILALEAGYWRFFALGVVHKTSLG